MSSHQFFPRLAGSFSIFSAALLFSLHTQPPLHAMENAGDSFPLIARFSGNARAAISLTFDDGFRREVADARSVIEPLGIRGTFFVMPLAMESTPGNFVSWDDLKMMQEFGHEVGTHARIRPRLHEVDADTVSGIVNGGWRLIRDHTGIAPVSFAYPGGTDQNAPEVRAIIAENHPFVRERSRSVGYGSAGRRVWTLERGQARVEKAIEEGEWIIPVIHAIVKGYSPFNSVEEFRTHCEWLVTQKDQLWIAPMGTVARYVEARDQSKIEILHRGDRELRFALESELDPALYNQPLTVLLPELPGDAPAATTAAGSLPLRKTPDGFQLELSLGSGPVTLTW